MGILKHGKLGWDVAMLQWRLDLFVTGYFDDRTVKAVKAFQTTHKLKVDGEVGPDTRKALELAAVETKMPFHPNKLWMTIAQSQIGVKYGEGFWLWSDNRKIMEYFTATDYPNPTPETWWCAAFVSWVMKNAGYQSSRKKFSAAAIKWLEWDGAVPVTSPEPGDIVIIRTLAAENAEKSDDYKSKEKTDELLRTGYHVGFYVSSPQGKVRILGGNQSKMVKEENYNLDTHVVKGYRRPKRQGNTALLKIGSAKGGCTLKGYEGCLPLATFTTGLEGATAMETGVAGRGSGVPQFETVSITRAGDSSAVSLLGLILKGGAGVDATVTSVSTNGREHWKHDYRNVMMTGYVVSIDEDGKITEGMMLSYSRVEVTCTPYDVNGKVCNPLRVAYDVGAAKLA